ncbi:hypothetical protein OIDMADRAFT_48802 [Oidiodendron maius Zn]|uniref:Uncharacterized protein n=1 Tax=Oidiodendron maius (strain Zn) TaxID=913774 RepID=A0A0C3HL53_OIDMZ|nr:hypothetical protein OIDMADRAFT_48802 [Oidiodendron maius Zn]
MEYARLLLGTNAARRLVDIRRWDDKRDAINIYASRSGDETISSLTSYTKSLGVAGGTAEGVWFMNEISEPSHLVDILAWVSWEAARFLGGYTTLLSNLTRSPVYQAHVKKTILIGPLYMPVDCDAYDPLETPQSIAKRLNCITLYSPCQKPEDTMVHIGLSNAFRQIERRHDIEIYYLRDKETNSHVVERVLINFSACITPSRTYSRTLPAFLESLQEKMGLNFIYEPIWRHSTIWNAIYAAKCWTGINPSDNIIENFRRKFLCEAGLQSYNHADNNSLYGALLAEPATETLQEILRQNQTCVFIAQDTLSLPMAYNISMISHSLEKRHLLDIPALSHIETHGNLRLIRRGWKLDKVAAISDNVADELRFVDPGFSNLDNIPICYPGILMLPCTINSKERARRLVLSYASAEWGYCLDPETTLIAVHIARVVRAKGFPRDISLIKALGQCLRAEGMSILLIIVTAWKGRGGQLVSDLLSASEKMNTPGSNVRLKVVNEFHWPDQTESGSSPTCFSRQDLHMATDISLGLSTYDTFAISPLEPVSCGAICMISTGCGCARRLQKLEGIESNILIADYGKRLDEILDVKDNYESIFEIRYLQKETLEEQATKEFAVELAEKVPPNTAQRTDSLARGIMIGSE